MSSFLTFVCAAENEPESNGESDGEDEKEGEGSGGGDAKDGARQDDNASANAETTKETSVESPKDEAQGMDVDKPAADTTGEGDQVGSSSKEPTAASQENKEECSPGDDENEKGEEEGEEDGEEEIDDVPTLQLAWEVLELARIIYDKEADKNGPRLAEIHLHLGEINMESGKCTCVCVCMCVCVYVCVVCVCVCVCVCVSTCVLVLE